MAQSVSNYLSPEEARKKAVFGSMQRDLRGQGIIPKQSYEQYQSLQQKSLIPTPNPIKVTQADPNSLGVAGVTQTSPNPILQGGVKGALNTNNAGTNIAKATTPIIPPPTPSAPTGGDMVFDASKGQLVPKGTEQKTDQSFLTTAGTSGTGTGSQAKPAPTNYAGMVQGLVGLSQKDSPEVLAERERLANLRNEYAQRNRGLEMSGAGMSVIGGEQGIAARQQAAQESAISQNLASAIATQGQRAGFLGQAAGLAAPQQVSPTNIPFDPLTGKFGQLAGSAATGGGGLAGIGALTQQAEQGANVQTMESAVQQSGALINKVKQDIATTGFNPAPSALGNALSAWIEKGVFPSPAWQNVINGLNEIVTTIAPVLGVPGNPTDAKLFMAEQLVPKLMAGESLPAVLDNLETNARIKIDAARKASQSNAVTNPSASATNTQTNGQSNSIWDF